jgi:hypothetical protein
MKLEYFENSVIVYTAAEGYGSTYSRWQSDSEYYEDDIVFNSDARFYRALKNNKGKAPNRSPDEWGFLHATEHPYFFLRDTAKMEDLRALLKHEHLYVKLYAFGALSGKNAEGLFAVILANLSDTTMVDQMTSDHGFPLCPSELMIMHLRKADALTTDQMLKLKALTQNNYKHLEWVKKILEEEID